MSNDKSDFKAMMEEMVTNEALMEKLKGLTVPEEDYPERTLTEESTEAKSVKEEPVEVKKEKRKTAKQKKIEEEQEKRRRNIKNINIAKYHLEALVEELNKSDGSIYNDFKLSEEARGQISELRWTLDNIKL